MKSLSILLSGRSTACVGVVAVAMAALAMGGTAAAAGPKPPAPGKAWVTDLIGVNPKQGSLVLHWTPTAKADGTPNAQYVLSGGKGCIYTTLPGDGLQPFSSGTWLITTKNYRVSALCTYGYKTLAVKTARSTPYDPSSDPTYTDKFLVPNAR